MKISITQIKDHSVDPWFGDLDHKNINSFIIETTLIFYSKNHRSKTPIGLFIHKLKTYA